MWNLRLKQTQDSVDQLSSWSWNFFSKSFVPVSRRKPALYLFLSTESKGSLSHRSEKEIDFVHRIQANGGGVVLTRPPFFGYVSDIRQVIEETAHLYTLSLQKSPPPPSTSRKHELHYSLLHESFGSFAQFILSPGFACRSQKDKDKLWNKIHSEALLLGKALARRFLDEEVQASQIARWLRRDWHSEKSSYMAYLELERLAKN